MTRSATVERYLETIWYIEAEGGPVRPSRLSNWLSVAAPTVTEALRRLERDGWVTLEKDRSVQLTKAGRDAADAVVRRHRVLERWLTDVLGFDWASADIEAERIAASISDEVIDRIDRSMGSPSTCPHGNVIPGRDPGYGELVALSDMTTGSSGRVRRISEVAEHEGQPLLRLLAEGGVAEGVHVSLVGRDEIAGDVLVEVDDTTIRVPEGFASAIWTSANVP